MASGHVNRTYRPNTWQHRPCNVKIALANLKPSTHGTFEPSRLTPRMSANWDKPEVSGARSE